MFRIDLQTADQDPENEEDCFGNITNYRQETMVHNPSVNVAAILNPYRGNKEDEMIIAPGEGNLHLPFLQDQFNEELCFIKIYGGELPIDYLNNRRFTYNAICRSEVRRYDRRVAENIPKLFYMTKKLLAKNMLSAIDTCLSKTKGAGLTVSDVLDRNKMNEYVSDSEASLMLRSCRSSPEFWKWKKMEINAMIRQLGCPNMFLTFSPAEKDWIDLLIILSKALDDTVLTYETASELSLEVRRNLLSRDPVNVSRYFENRMISLFKLIFKENTVFSENPVSDSFWRVDFQYSGSPHIHMLAWLKNAPAFQPEVGSDLQKETNKRECRKFIDKYITCERPPNDEIIDYMCPEKEPFNLRYQFHRHMKNCKYKDSEGEL